MSIISLFATAQKVVEPNTDGHPEWSNAYPPLRIAGNLYYVGTEDLACYLIITSKGNILINTGLTSSATQIKANIETLGFKYADIKILLTTQAHYDHMGAMATVKKQTGAKMMVDAGDAEVMADGGKSDYALGGEFAAYEPVKADKLLHDKDVIQLGDMRLTLLHHPGHTKGSCSYIFDVKDNTRTYRVLIANIPTIVTDKRFSDIPAYPNIAKDYANTLSTMRGLTFDIWLASHGTQFDLKGKHKPGNPYNPMAFADRKGYDAAIAEAQTAYDKKMKQ